ncbi:MAG TPA: carboxypeptidase-like regulatory domain-containing protein [Chitinophagaceae bacterium]|nr:carboxypeptidase-like regulatory domain-containing protein [Chitinophagaceae bacterium]
MRRGLRLILPVLFLLPVFSFSQFLKGRVLAESGEVAAGVTVQFKNKLNGISTNADGSFKIMAAKLPDTLIFSAPGFESYKVVITEKNIKDPNFEVVLLNKREELSEVIVTSYGTARKRNMTGYAGAISDDRLLAGKVAGVEISGSAGSASTIRKRGSSSPKMSYSATVPGDVMMNKSLFFADSNIGPRGGSLAKSRILTAGEINDFNKWKMWEDYTDNEFKTWSEYWGIMPKKRFSIQATDKNHNAVINEAVYLISKSTKDTIWRSYTDNTGKAELWPGFFRDSMGKRDCFIADRYGNIINHPSEFSNGVNLLAADKSCGFSNDVDIAFVVDATGSMGDEIEFLKLELEDVIRNSMEKYKSLTLNAASVFYRDRGDEYVTKHVAFNDDLLKAINFIKLQSAGGGGDYPEAVDDALSTALDSLQWHSTARTKLLFLILDAPAHDYARDRIRRLTLKAAAMGIRIVPIACSGTDKSTEFLLRSMALATNGTYAFLTNHSGVGNSHIEPTTDKYEAELLNNLLQRVIGQFLYAKDCSVEDAKQLRQQETHQPENILSIKVYPNPTSGQFIIESKNEINEIFVTDFTGKILMRLPVSDKKAKWQVDISRYPSGTYLVKYITKENKWGAEKIILVR